DRAPDLAQGIGARTTAGKASPPMARSLPLSGPMEREPGRGEAERRRGRERRRGQDRRAGGSLGSRARFSLLYFVIAFLLLIGLNYLLGQYRKSTRLNSSHVKISYAGFC